MGVSAGVRATAVAASSEKLFGLGGKSANARSTRRASTRFIASARALRFVG